MEESLRRYAWLVSMALGVVILALGFALNRYAWIGVGGILFVLGAYERLKTLAATS